MGAMADGHGAELRTALTRVRRRWLAARWLHALARVAVGACIGLLLVIGVELLVAPPDVPLLLVAGAALLATLAFGARVLWPLRRPPSDDRVARLVEESCPELEDRVASAAAISASGPATGFRELVLADAAERLRGIEPARVVAPARLRRAAVRGVLALAVLAAVVALGSTPLSRIAATAWLHALPSGAELAVDPGDFRLMAGQPFRVSARFSSGGVTGRTPPILSVLDGMTPRDVRMRPAGDGYLAEFPSVTRSFRYRVGAAAFTTRDYLVEALSPPRVTRIDVEYAYPAFTGLPPRVEEDGGDLFAPAGTAARLVVHTDKPVAEGALALSDGRRVALDDAGDGRRTATLVVEGNGRYAVRVVDAHGLSNRDTADYLIRATTDRPPAVRVVLPGGDREVTPLEEVAIEVRADDDHAVDRLDLVYTVAGRADRALPFDIPERSAAVTGVRTLFVEDLAVEPGDVITYFARVRDAGRAGVSTEARSDLYFLEIRPFDNAFEEALSQGGLGPEAAEIGRLVGLQKQIIVATWRLERQPEGGTAEDVRAVAEVQGDLRDTAAGAAGRMSVQRRRGAIGDDAGPEAQRRAMAAAVEAMGAAEAALSELDLASAMPHETEALNQLLTAQAAVRRRQVSMQPGRGSGGQQAQLDLSALFDRELRREQETSYETGRQPGAEEAGEDSEDGEALDRLRELARRQERINRDLRESSQNGTDEERRRVLERLEREQQALRAELEVLAERLGRPSGAEGRSGSRGPSGAEGQPGAEGPSGAEGRSGSAGQSGSGRTAGEELRRAAEQMQRATNRLRREEGDAAREHGDQAADALRRLAERLRGAGAGERAGALGDLQLEAQQIARAQRRLAGEMELAADGARSPGYRGLMAGEKDDLADRTEALEQGLSALAEGGDAGAGAPAAGESDADPSIAEAHRTLVGEEVAERMRAGAERLRALGGRSPGPRASGGSASPGDPQAADSPGDPQAEEAALADVLGAVAGLLQRAMMQDEGQRRLAAELETARRLRERLQGAAAEDDAPGSARGDSGDARSGEPTGDAPSGEPSGEARSGGRSASAARSGPEAGAAGDGAGQEEGSSEPGAGPSATVGRGGSGEAASGREAALDLARHPGLLRALAEADPGLAADLEGWARQWRSLSAPGTDAARLDFAHWTSLRRELITALQRFERDRSRELADRALRDRYAAGADDAVPERYRRLVEQYYRSLAGAPRTVR